MMQYIVCLKNEQATVTSITVSDVVSVVRLGALFEVQNQRNWLLQNKVWVFEVDGLLRATLRPGIHLGGNWIPEPFVPGRNRRDIGSWREQEPHHFCSKRGIKETSRT